MRHLDLFSGIGGFALAASWTGAIETVAFCEIEPYAQKVLTKNFPGVPIYEDVRELTAERLAADGIDSVDLITGGFPCQPHSRAGKRKGRDDDRHLWPAMLRVIASTRPSWVIGENVAGIVDNMVLDDVQSDLEGIGYEVQPLIVPACAVNAEHERDRVWILAHLDAVRQLQSQGREQKQRGWTGDGAQEDVADFNQARRKGRVQTGAHRADVAGFQERDRPCLNHARLVSREHWDHQPVLGRGIHGVSNRLDRIGALGNAIVPQVVYPILKAISEITLCSQNL